MKRLIILAALCFPWAPVGAQNTGGVSGVVRNDQGSPIGGATVRLGRLPKTVPVRPREKPRIAPGEQLINRLVTTKPDGTFRADSLPSGSYQYCVSGPKPYLNACQWFAWRMVSVVAGQTVPIPDLRLSIGATLRIEVSDPAGRAQPSGFPGAAPNMQIGVQTTTGAYHPAYPIITPIARCVGKQLAPDICEEDLPNSPIRRPTAKALELTVPGQIPLTVWVHAPGLSLTDDRGVAISGTGAHSTLQLSAGAAPSVVRLNVVGTRTP
jgi:hypothetical protein